MRKKKGKAMGGVGKKIGFCGPKMRARDSPNKKILLRKERRKKRARKQAICLSRFQRLEEIKRQ